MCGILGLFDKENYSQELKAGWSWLDERGTDSYGVVLATPTGLKIIKALKKDVILEEVEKIEQQQTILWALAHNRKASVGSVNLELAHPIYNNNSIIIHNGTKKTIVELFNKYKSDTQALLYLLQDLPKQYKSEILQKAGVVFHFNLKERLLLFHKSNRSLYISEDLSYLSSAPIAKGNWYKIQKIDLLELKITKKNIFSLLPRENKKEYFYKKICKSCKNEFFTSNAKETECKNCKSVCQYGYWQNINTTWRY